MDVILFDSAKAFDKIPNQRLLNKFNSHGFHSIQIGIKSWLENRVQRVFLNGKSSTWGKALSGVLRGQSRVLSSS